MTMNFPLRWQLVAAWLRRVARLVPVAVLLAVAVPVHAQELRFARVADGVYAHVGELGGRTAANQGLNANIGLVLAPGGAVLIAMPRCLDAHLLMSIMSSGGDRPHRWSRLCRITA